MSINDLRARAEILAAQCERAYGSFNAGANRADADLSTLWGVVTSLNENAPAFEATATSLKGLANELGEGNQSVQVAQAASKAIGPSHNADVSQAQAAVQEMYTANMDAASQRAYELAGKASEYALMLLTAAYGLQELQSEVPGVFDVAAAMRDVALPAATQTRDGASRW